MSNLKDPTKGPGHPDNLESPFTAPWDPDKVVLPSEKAVTVHRDAAGITHVHSSPRPTNPHPLLDVVDPDVD